MRNGNCVEGFLDRLPCACIGISSRLMTLGPVWSEWESFTFWSVFIEVGESLMSFEFDGHTLANLSSCTGRTDRDSDKYYLTLWFVG